MLSGWSVGKLSTGSGRGRSGKIRNILVVTEYFLAGGLETQICSQVDYLKTCGIQVHLATSSPSSELAANTFSTVLCGLSMRDTAEAFLETVASVEKHVQALDIDVIHAHPFFSFALAMVVAHRTQRPLAATLHGPTSVSAGSETIFGLLLQRALLPNVNMLCCVSPEVALLAQSTSRCVPVLLPNAIRVSRIAPELQDRTLPWVWAGRIDHEKIVGLRALIASVVQFKSNVLHIYGDGPEVPALQHHLKEVDPRCEWTLYKGWDFNLIDRIGEYSLVAGMGRVLLEGAAASRPCLLVGYDGIKGVMSRKKMVKASYWNFSGRGLRSIDRAELEEQLQDLQRNREKYLLRDWVRENHSADIVWKEYLGALPKLNLFSSDLVEKFHECLRYAGESSSEMWSDNNLYTVLNGVERNSLEGCR